MFGDPGDGVGEGGEDNVGVPGPGVDLSFDGTSEGDQLIL